MIRKDKFETFESHGSDKSLFWHLANTFLVFGLSLGIEQLVQYSVNRDQASYSLLIICAGAVVGGGVFGALAVSKGIKQKRIRKQLFDEQQLVSDVTTLVRTDGTSVVLDHLSQDASSPPR